MGNLAQAIEVESRESTGIMPNELAEGLNAIQRLCIGQARHNLQYHERDEQWTARKAQQTDRLLANCELAVNLTEYGLTPEQIERLQVMEVADLAVLLRQVL